jgi:hypothetical protein
MADYTPFTLTHTVSLSDGAWAWGAPLGHGERQACSPVLVEHQCATCAHITTHNPSATLPSYYLHTTGSYRASTHPHIHTSTHPRIRLRPHNSAPGLDHGSGADLNLDPDLCPYAVSCQITCPFDPFSSSAHLQGCTVCTVCPAQRLWLASFSRLSVAHVFCPLPRFSKPHRLLSSSSCPSSVALDNLIVVWSVRVSYQD